MNDAATDHRTPDGRSPTNVELLRSPVDYIAEDHLRLRTMCAEMDKLAEADRPDPEASDALRDYLSQELPTLLADEDEDLIPLVLQRAEPEDEVPRLIRRLDEEHRRIAQHLTALRDWWAGGPGITPIPDEMRATLRDLAAVTRRHLILENAILLPLARVRLTAEDLAALRRSMLARRGLDDLPGARTAASRTSRGSVKE